MNTPPKPPSQEQQRFQKTQNVQITSVHPHDVLSGKGKGSNKHPGNIFFRLVVGEHRRAYLLQDRNSSRTKITQKILECVKSLNPPGRFLMKQDDGSWREAEDNEAMNKARQCLSEGAPQLRAIILTTGAESLRCDGNNTRKRKASKSVTATKMATAGPESISRKIHSSLGTHQNQKILTPTNAAPQEHQHWTPEIQIESRCCSPTTCGMEKRSEWKSTNECDTSVYVQWKENDTIQKDTVDMVDFSPSNSTKTAVAGKASNKPDSVHNTAGLARTASRSSVNQFLLDSECSRFLTSNDDMQISGSSIEHILADPLSNMQHFESDSFMLENSSNRLNLLDASFEGFDALGLNLTNLG